MLREKFFGKYPELKDLVSSMTDRDVWKLNRGGHDPHKVYAAYDAAMKTKGTTNRYFSKNNKRLWYGQIWRKY